ncbi:hypothetical protein HN385_00365 [archaeon]|jgi:CheY-like chemotaxis protein|nr:hypothetical protein [archaeon]MBT3451623.1 hypothetical protein [archaeon]MBT6869644.1 hypothetical protein [archaeon]MBT7192412.1 hypothetical protein [archaeon]MBT7380213.1 hypothetical protein [archaeon]
MKEDKKLEILVVEGDEKHIGSMEKLIRHQKESMEYPSYGRFHVEISYARSYDELESMLEDKRYDAIISDVFLPRSEGKETELVGTKVMDLVRKYDLKLVFCTSEYFQSGTESFLKEAKKEGVLHVESFDSGTWYSKDWSKAFTYAVVSAVHDPRVFYTEGSCLPKPIESLDVEYSTHIIDRTYGRHDEIDVRSALEELSPHKTELAKLE